MDKADDEPTTAPRRRASSGREWLALSRRKRNEIIKQNQRLVDEATEAQRRPGSNAPATTDAEVAAYWRSKREDIAKVLPQARITHPGQQRMYVEVFAASHAYQNGYNVAQAGLWALRAIISPHDAPGEPLRDLDALAAPRILLNAIEDAVAGKPARFLALLPEKTPQDGAGVSTADLHRACVAAGIAALWGKAQRGGVTQKIAKGLVSKAFEEADISITQDSALEFFKRIQRGDDTAAVLDLYEKLTVDFPAARPLPERKACLKRLADHAGRTLET